jgi:hypothetical protein
MIPEPTELEIKVANQALYDELEHQYDPLDTIGNPMRRRLSIGDNNGDLKTGVYVANAVWMGWGELWYLELYDHYNLGGDTRLDALWSSLKLKRDRLSLSAINWAEETVYEQDAYGRNDWRRPKGKVWQSRNVDLYVYLNPTLLEKGGSGYEMRKRKFPNAEPPTASYLIRPRIAFLGDTSQHFPLFFEKSLSKQARMWKFFQHLKVRTQLPFLPNWAAPLWDAMQDKMIEKMRDFGTIEGYWVKLDQLWIARWQSQAIKTGLISAPGYEHLIRKAA